MQRCKPALKALLARGAVLGSHSLQSRLLKRLEEVAGNGEVGDTTRWILRKAAVGYWRCREVESDFESELTSTNVDFLARLDIVSGGDGTTMNQVVISS